MPTEAELREEYKELIAKRDKFMLIYANPTVQILDPARYLMVIRNLELRLNEIIRIYSLPAK